MTTSDSRRQSEITTDKANHWIIILMDQQTAAHIKKIMDLTTLALPAANTASARQDQTLRPPHTRGWV